MGVEASRVSKAKSAKQTQASKASK